MDIDVSRWIDIAELGDVLKRHGIDTPSNALVMDLMKWHETPIGERASRE